MLPAGDITKEGGVLGKGVSLPETRQVTLNLVPSQPVAEVGGGP